MKEAFQTLGFSPADILLPQGVDLTKWAVVACDQFTSQPEYWEAVERAVGDAPSALRLILPEAALGGPDTGERIAAINGAMGDYLDRGLFREYPASMIYIQRTQSDGKVRQGLLGMIDLERYDFTPGSSALIRATEGTVLSRIPPRVQVRRDALIELPHVMLLIDDPGRTVIEPLGAAAGEMEKLYGFELMQGGGALAGWRLTEAQTAAVSSALAGLIAPEAMERKYGLRDAPPLLFAVGDGNHSLATAKQCWEDVKKTLPASAWEGYPARYALAEAVNLHDEALQFEPIHRAVFHVDPEALLKALLRAYPGAHEGEGEGHTVAFVTASRRGCVTVPRPKAQLAVGTLQSFLDGYLRENGGEVDYIHGGDVAEALGSRPESIAFLLPAMGKDQLFKTVIADGVLPRKTFSMGHAQDKRYYVEARRIR